MDARKGVAGVVVMTAMMAGIVEGAGGEDAAADRYRVYIGTYTSRGSKGIYRAILDVKDGSLWQEGVTEGVVNPSFLAIHPDGRHLYSVAEIESFEGRKGGGVAAFAVEPDGSLTLLNKESSGGAGPCHLVVDRAGKNVLVANYGGGSVAALPIESDGRLRKLSSFVQHAGKSVHPGRQEGPHAHSINVDAAGAIAVAADLGLDKVLIYRFDADQGKLSPNDPPHAAVEPGSGPRHFAFHPGGKFAYVINELASTVTAFAYDPAKGELRPLQTISTLPEGESVDNTTAEVVAHPSGKFLYGSNRGHDSIAIFRIDPSTGKLTPAGHQKTGGKTPRNFALDPSGRFLLAANQDTGTVVVFRIDPDTGALSPTGGEVSVPMPVCVRFLPLR